MESDSGDRTGDNGGADDSEPVDGGPTPGGVTTYEFNDEGKYVNVETGEEYAPGPDLIPLEETLPQWLWDQHNTPPAKEVEP